MSKYYIGIDIGSVSVDGAIVTAEKEIVRDYYLRHKGHTLRTFIDLLGKMLEAIAFNDILSISLTGSGGKVVSELLNIPFVNEVIAFAEANSFLYPRVNSIIEVGGEDSRFISLKYNESLDKNIISDFSMNSLCAAGTGSFLDQQATRLGLTIENFGKVALRSKNPATIAGRCSTFAKTDMIHLQQVATPNEDIVSGLCYSLVRNFQSTIAKGKVFKKVISFQGGVAANEGVIDAFEKRLGLASGELFVPSNHATLGAIGAAIINLQNNLERFPFKSIQEIKDKLTVGERAKTSLEKLVISEEHHPKNPEGSGNFDIKNLSDNQIIDVFLGVDIGSISTNLALINKEGRLISKRYLQTGGRPIEAVRKGLISLNEEIGEKIRVQGVCTTGSGRYMIAKIIGADVVRNEITAQARAAINIDKDVDTIFEIGGQDSKYISIKDGVVIDFEMNKVCAAGTGSFLEEQAERLNININNEFSQLALDARNPVELGERCTVFMNSNIGHFQAMGTSREDIAARILLRVYVIQLCSIT